MKTQAIMKKKTLLENKIFQTFTAIGLLVLLFIGHVGLFVLGVILTIALDKLIGFPVSNEKYIGNEEDEIHKIITDPSYSCLEGNLFHDSLCK